MAYHLVRHADQYARKLATTGFFERSTRYRALVRITHFMLILYRPISQSNYTCKMQIRSFGLNEKLNSTCKVKFRTED